MDKKKIVIWANCQGSAIHKMLSKYYDNTYDILLYKNFEYIRTNKDLPTQFKDADIFLYQNYSDKEGIYNLNHIILNVLKPSCIKICFPTLHSCELLFCYNVYEQNNNKTISNDFPFGKFYYGIGCLKKYVDTENIIGMSFDKIFDKIYCDIENDNFIDEKTILYYNKKTFEFLQLKCLNSDVPELYDYILNNFTKIRLWHNPNHPTGILLNKLVYMVFLKLGLFYDAENEKNILELENLLNDWVLPIFPCVKKYYNLNFEDKCSSWYSPEITDTKTYIKSYLNTIYF